MTNLWTRRQLLGARHVRVLAQQRRVRRVAAVREDHRPTVDRQPTGPLTPPGAAAPARKSLVGSAGGDGGIQLNIPEDLKALAEQAVLREN